VGGKSWGRTPGGAQHSSDLAVNAAVLGFVYNPHINLSIVILVVTVAALNASAVYRSSIYSCYLFTLSITLIRRCYSSTLLFRPIS